MTTMYTANQPLFLGGAVYMWNRYSKCKYLVHMEEAQFSKFGHQSRVELIGLSEERKSMVVLPLQGRAFKRLNECYVDSTSRTIPALVKTIQGMYPRKKVAEPVVLDTVCSMLMSFTGKDVTVTEFSIPLTDYLVGLLLPELKVLRSMDIVPVRDENPSIWVASFNKHLQCDQYIGGAVAGAEYINKQDFTDAGCEPVYQDYKMRPYSVGKGGMNTSAVVAVLDPVFRHGIEFAQELIKD